MTHITPSTLNRMLPYPVSCHSFGNTLMPAYSPCRTARPVSCYALFKRMAASKPTSWLSRQSYFVFST